MPLQNRVLATGEIIAHPARGLFMGNRGILHDERKHLGPARWRHKTWVICVLSFKERRRTLMTPNRYTELFFLDEAVALAAGHRPCGECRRAAYAAYLAALNHTGGAKALDARLHAARALPRTRTQRRHMAEIATLPDGAIILTDTPHLVQSERLHPVTASGYDAPRPRPASGTVTVLTPEPSLNALRYGYRPLLHPSATL